MTVLSDTDVSSIIASHGSATVLAARYKISPEWVHILRRRGGRRSEGVGDAIRYRGDSATMTTHGLIFIHALEQVTIRGVETWVSSCRPPTWDEAMNGARFA